MDDLDIKIQLYVDIQGYKIRKTLSLSSADGWDLGMTDVEYASSVMYRLFREADGLMREKFSKEPLEGTAEPPSKPAESLPDASS